MDDQEVRKATAALHVLHDLRSGYRVDVLGLGTFTFHPYRHETGALRLLPGGGITNAEEATALLARGFVQAMGRIQQRLEEGNGV